MSHVFISYSKKDQTYARRLVDRLRDEGFDVWIDDRELRSSDDWWRSIVQAIWSCGAFLVILTPNSDASKWVQREIAVADKRDKPMFPLLLSGDLNSPNWSIFFRTQYDDVRDYSFPDNDFFEKLGQYAVRHAERGQNLTATDEIDRVAMEDPSFRDILRNPPPPEPEDDERTFLQRYFRFLMIVGLPAAAVVIVIAVGIFFIPPGPPDPTPTTPPATPTVVVAGGGPTPVTPAATAVQTISTLDPLNNWRAQNGFSPLVVDDTLAQVAELHLSDLLSRQISQIGNLYRDADDGRSIQEIAAEAGYSGEVVAFIVVDTEEVRLPDLLADLDERTEIDHETFTQVGLATERPLNSDLRYFVLILGDA